MQHEDVFGTPGRLRRDGSVPFVVPEVFVRRENPSNVQVRCQGRSAGEEDAAALSESLILNLDLIYRNTDVSITDVC